MPKADAYTETEQFKKFLQRSTIFHGALVVLVLFAQFFSGSAKKAFTPSLKVDLVGLPDITKKQAAQNDTGLSELEKKLEEKSEPVKRTKEPEVKTDENVISLKKVKEQSKSKTGTKNALKNAIDRIKALEAIEADEKKNKKHTNKFMGNQLSKGNSLSGQEALEAADAYADNLQNRLKSNWDLPVWLAQQKLSAQAQIFLDAQGNVQHSFISKSSGNAQFDDYVLKTIRKSEPFGTPPGNWVGTAIELGFPL